MLIIAWTLGIIIVLCLLSAFACWFWRNTLRQRRLFVDALLAQVAEQRRENQRQMQWVREEGTRLQEESAESGASAIDFSSKIV